MDLLLEAKKSDKKAFNELVKKYYHIFYKVARIFLNNDNDISYLLEKALSQTFKDIVNAKDEREFVCLASHLIVENYKKLKKNRKKKGKTDPKIIQINISDNISSSESSLKNLEYQSYHKASVVESYITSIDEEYRLIAILYYYADLTPEEISKIIKIKPFVVRQKIDAMRIKLYEIIKNKEVISYNEYV